MSLRRRLEEDARAATLAREALRRDTLRMVLSQVKSREIDSGRDASDEEVLEILATAVKTRLDSAGQFERAGREELAAKERAEVLVIQEYLPRQLSEEETRAAVAEAIAETGASSKADIGKVMKAVMARHKGALDGKLAQKLAAERLGG